MRHLIEVLGTTLVSLTLGVQVAVGLSDDLVNYYEHIITEEFVVIQIPVPGLSSYL